MPSTKFQKGVIPLAILGVGFLIATLATVTASTNNPLKNYAIQSWAKAGKTWRDVGNPKARHAGKVAEQNQTQATYQAQKDLLTSTQALAGSGQLSLTEADKATIANLNGTIERQALLSNDQIVELVGIINRQASTPEVSGSGGGAPEEAEDVAAPVDPTTGTARTYLNADGTIPADIGSDARGLGVIRPETTRTGRSMTGAGVPGTTITLKPESRATISRTGDPPPDPDETSYVGSDGKVYSQDELPPGAGIEINPLVKVERTGSSIRIGFNPEPTLVGQVRTPGVNFTRTDPATGASVDLQVPVMVFQANTPEVSLGDNITVNVPSLKLAYDTLVRTVNKITNPGEPVKIGKVVPYSNTVVKNTVQDASPLSNYEQLQTLTFTTKDEVGNILDTKVQKYRILEDGTRQPDVIRTFITNTGLWLGLIK